MTQPLTSQQRDLAAANLALVPWVITRKLHRTNNDPEWDDLYQDGCIGLIDAARRFDPDKGFTFSTYAVRTIWGNVVNGSRDRNGTTTRKRRIQTDSLDFMVAEGLELVDLVADPEAPFDDRVADRDLLTRIVAAFDGNAKHQETVLDLAGGLPSTELARRHGVSHRTIYNRRKAIEQQLSQLQIKDVE